MKLDELKAYATRNLVPIAMDQTCDFICSYIKANQVSSVLELGTAIGYSAIKFAQAREDVRVTSIEIDIDRYIRAVQNVRDAQVQGRVTLVHADALTFRTDQRFDLIFIDAAKAQYIKFFEKYKENLSEGGVIISDNLAFHGMVDDLSLTHNYSTKKLVKKIRRYVDFLSTNPEFETEFLEIGDRLAISRRREQSAATS